MLSQKEMAAKLQKDLKEVQKERVEISVIQGAKNEVTKEKQIAQAVLQQVVAEKGYLISVPNTEIILYEDDGYQMLYCNNIDHPGKVIFLVALKAAARNITGRTAITSQGYVAVPMSRDVFNLILASHQSANKTITNYKERINDLEKEIAPLKYIDHLIKAYKIDTK